MHEAITWPMKHETGMFKLACSCGNWEFVGDYEAMSKATRRHDDSPKSDHIVRIEARASSMAELEPR